jgi:glycerophosphoryl diester phosphodiesterase
MDDSAPAPGDNPRTRFFAQTKVVDVIAHRGGNGQWPGETVYAFRQALKGSSDVIEMDVWGTADDSPVLVLMHSSNVGKTTDGTKKLPFCKYEELENLNAAYRWSPDGGETFPFANTEPVLRVAKLEDVLDEFKDHRMNIEIKQKRPSIVKPFLDLIQTYQVPPENLLIASFHTRVLEELRAECRNRNLPIATSASTWEWLKFYFINYLLHRPYKRSENSPEAIQMAERLPLLRIWLLSRRFIHAAHAAGFKIHAWTVDNSNDMQRAIVSGVDGIITDFPGPLRAIIDEPERDRSLPRDNAGPTRSALFNKWSLFRTRLAGLFSILMVVRFSLLTVLFPAIAMIFIDQGSEALRILATAPKQPTSQVVAFIVGLITLTFMTWYWASILVDILRPGAREEGSLKGWAARQLPRICGLIPAVAVAIALIVAYEPFRSRSSPPTEVQSSEASYDRTVSEEAVTNDTRVSVEVKDSPVRFIVFAVACIVFTIPVYALFYWRRRRLEHYYDRHPDYAWQLGKAPPSDRVESRRIPVTHLPGASKVILTITILVWLGLLLIFTIQTGDRPITIAPAKFFGPLAIAMLFAAVWIPFGSLLVFWSDKFKLPLFTILLVLAGLFSIFNINDNHQIRRVDNNPAPQIPDLNTAFTDWLNNRCDRNPDPNVPYPVFIVSAEGGGSRTAYFTSLVLSAIQDRNPQFAHHLFGISGVSGGSVGGTVFAALTDKYVQRNPGAPCTFANKQNMQSMTNAILGQDLLSPVLAGALYPDLIQRFLFWPVARFDRARALEDGLGQAWFKATGSRDFSRAHSFYELSNNFANRSTPALFLNTTQVETGQRMVVSSLALSTKDGAADDNLSGLLSIGRIPKIVSPNLSLATAAFLSARFPVITPPGSIGPKNERSRYVDGGYFENSGTATLIDLIFALPLDQNSQQKDSTQQPQQKIKLIVINIGTDPVDLKYSSRGIGEITGPIVALLNTRSARGDSATNQLGTVVNKINTRQGNSAEIVHFQADQNDLRLPTGWLLSEQALQNMQCQLGIAADNSQNQCSVLSPKPATGSRVCGNDRTCLARVGQIFSGQ